jgi:hypothetical protein
MATHLDNLGYEQPKRLWPWLLLVLALWILAALTAAYAGVPVVHG